MRLFNRTYKSALGPLVLLGLLGTAQVHADERILSYDSTITVNQDGTLEVREAIRVRAEGQNIRRGIYRDFPTIYARADGGNTVVGFNFQSAKRDGSDEPWRTENRGNGVRVYLGSPSRTVSHGEHTYELVYRTDRQMGYFAGHDELFWNVTGNGWGFVIDRVTARVLLPDEIPRSDIRLEAYTGPQGAKGQAFTSRLDDGAPLFETTQPLLPGEGLTIVAMWPKGFIMPPVESAQPVPSRGMTAGADHSYAAAEDPRRGTTRRPRSFSSVSCPTTTGHSSSACWDSDCSSPTTISSGTKSDAIRRDA